MTKFLLILDRSPRGKYEVSTLILTDQHSPKFMNQFGIPDLPGRRYEIALWAFKSSIRGKRYKRFTRRKVCQLLKSGKWTLLNCIDGDALPGFEKIYQELTIPDEVIKSL